MSTETIKTTGEAREESIQYAFPEHGFVLPAWIRSLAHFRQWTYSDEFPERGRIDYVANRIEVDMSPENLLSHGPPKVEIVRVLANRVKGQKLGEIYVDRGRISNPKAELSAEPDVMFVSYDTLKSGRARKIPVAKDAGGYIEVEGAVDLVVVVISDSSVTKDTKRLPAAYHDAGVREFWLVDARGTDFVFTIHHRGKTKFDVVESDDERFQVSKVFKRRYRLDREPHPISDWLYDLREADPSA